MPNPDQPRADAEDDADAGAALLSVRGVEHRFGDRRVLDAVDVDVRPGRVAVAVAGVALVLRAALLVCRRGIVRTGARVHLREVLRPRTA